MRTVLVVSLAVLLVAGAALAQSGPMVKTPEVGAKLGPNYDVIGTAGHKAFLIVMTDVVNADTGEVLRSVPGIRHWTTEDGTFHFRAASPRVSIGERDTPLKYRVRVFESSESGTPGTETVIEAGMAQ